MILFSCINCVTLPTIRRQVLQEKDWESKSPSSQSYSKQYLRNRETSLAFKRWGSCCKEMDYLELRVCTEMCLSQLQSGTKTLEQSMETTSLLLHTNTCCKDFHGVFFLLIPVKRNLDLSCPFATWLTHQPLSQVGYSEITLSQGICQNISLHSLWSVPSN